MKAKFLPMLLIAVLGLNSTAAFAQDGEQSEDADSPWVSTLTFVSDYRFRGISQNLNDPALQFGTTYYHSTGLYVGAFGSNVDFGGAVGANLEVDIYGGWGGELAEGLTGDLQLIRYNYPGDDIPLAYTELNAKLSYAGLTGLVGYSNDVFNTNETGIYYNLAYSLLVADTYNFTAALGRYDLSDSSAYGGNITDYSVGVSRNFGDALTVGFSYIDTNGAFESVYGETNDSQFVFSMGATF
jgi:uncharacterized protein (TIGR02001 family)